MRVALPSGGSEHGALRIGLGWSGLPRLTGLDMRWMIALLIVLLVALQYRLWVGQGSLAELHSLKQEIALQEAEITRLIARNQVLQAEVADLGEGREALEERARTELGMIKAGEIFIQVIEQPKPTQETSP